MTLSRKFAGTLYRLRHPGRPLPVIDTETVYGYDAIRDPHDRGSICHAPSVNMLFAQDGSVHVCCHNSGYALGKYPEQSIREMWNGEKAMELRRAMRRYDLSKGCNTCDMDMRPGMFSEVRALQFDRLPRLTDRPTMMEFLISNQCGLECVMCNGEFSSAIRKNREKLPPQHSPYDERLVTELEEFIPHLHQMRFSSSGEPFSIALNHAIWQSAVRLNPDCRILVQTSGMVLTERVRDILDRGNFHIGISFDSLDPTTYESIRVNARFGKVMENIRYFNSYSVARGRRLCISMCVMQVNWHETPDMVRFCNSLGADILFHRVWYPHNLALHSLPPEGLRQVAETLAAAQLPDGTPLERSNLMHYRTLVGVVRRWADAATLRAENGKEAGKEPMERLWERLKALIARGVSDGHPTEMGHDALSALCVDRMESLLGSLDRPEDRMRAMQSMCAFPAEYVVALLRDNTPETLARKAEAYFKRGGQHETAMEHNQAG
jgi:radical SAM protein with 4Fe4S-binding SPASM domain